MKHFAISALLVILATVGTAAAFGMSEMGRSASHACPFSIALGLACAPNPHTTNMLDHHITVARALTAAPLDSGAASLWLALATIVFLAAVYPLFSPHARSALLRISLIEPLRRPPLKKWHRWLVSVRRQMEDAVVSFAYAVNMA